MQCFIEPPSNPFYGHSSGLSSIACTATPRTFHGAYTPAMRRKDRSGAIEAAVGRAGDPSPQWGEVQPESVRDVAAPALILGLVVSAAVIVNKVERIGKIDSFGARMARAHGTGAVHVRRLGVGRVTARGTQIVQKLGLDCARTWWICASC